MIQFAASKGLPASSVESLYVKGEDVVREHEKRNGYDRPHGPGGVCVSSKDPIGKAFAEQRAREMGLSF
jgi:hypothetical protein